MHISEGVLNAPVLLSGAALSFAGVAIGLKKLSFEKVPEVGVLASVFFIASLVHVPIGPAAAHLVLNGLCGLLLGWAAFPAIFVGLTLQAVLFQFGGLTALGVNTFNIAFPAVVLGLPCRRLLKSRSAIVRGLAEFVAGGGAILLSGFMVATSLVLTGESFTAAAKLIVLAHLPVMAIEGALTIFAAEFIRRLKPEMLGLTRNGSFGNGPFTSHTDAQSKR